MGYIRWSAYGLNGSAWCYLEIGNLDKAIQYSEKAIAILKRLGEKYAIAGALETYACILGRKKKMG